MGREEGSGVERRCSCSQIKRAYGARCVWVGTFACGDPKMSTAATIQEPR